LNITVHNLYPDLELTYLVHFSNIATCYVYSNQQIDTGNIMEAGFDIDRQDSLRGALLYKLQRKYIAKTDNQPDNGTESIKDTVISMYLLVVWNSEWNQYGFYACLIECTNGFIWDEDKLWTLYDRCKEEFSKDYKDNMITWLMNDDTLMKTKFDVTYGSDYKLDVIISEGTRKHGIKESILIDLERLVLPLSMLIVLMYAASLSIKPSVRLNIHNQCLNIDLVSPKYSTHYGLKCHRAPDYKVCAGDIMRSSFIIRSDDAAYSVLIYRLRKRQPRESTETSEDASNAVHLLVVWRISKPNEFYADVLLVEYDKDFIWDDDNLRDLRLKNVYPSKLHSGSTTEIWSLNDSAALMTTSEIMNEDRTVNITISELEKYHSTRIPIRIDLKR
jgi:hypothetical protein